ncbi:MAG: UDP-2,3-diacylglucosamine hydrolase [Bacteroidetes bacterium 4572_77]|nr:MAG: UDP-2,3-diacylglucosamine hydrolase [Bacteroidetes bacterium 4572_77]
MIYFVSDVHLGFFNRKKDKQREILFTNFLKNIKEDCTELFLLGDIFDYWFDYKTVIPKDFYYVVAELRNIKEAGIPITYIMGNHDFGHYSFFKEELGIDVIDHDIIREIDGKKFYLSHGDGKIPTEHGYNFVKKVLRNKINQKLYRLLHPDIGIPLARGSNHTTRKTADAQQNIWLHEGMQKNALQKLDEGYDYVIYGHRHTPEIYQYKHGKYINIGDWLTNFSYITYNNGEFKINLIDKSKLD